MAQSHTFDQTIISLKPVLCGCEVVVLFSVLLGCIVLCCRRAVAEAQCLAAEAAEANRLAAEAQRLAAEAAEAQHLAAEATEAQRLAEEAAEAQRLAAEAAEVRRRVQNRRDSGARVYPGPPHTCGTSQALA